MRGRVRAAAVVLALLVSGSGACSSRDREEVGNDLRGRRVEILAVWEDVEAARFQRVLRRFERATGATVEFTSTAGRDIGAVLDERIAAGDPPDLAVLPQPGLLQRYAADGTIVRIDDLVGDAVDAHWSATWQRLGSVDGHLYGLWFKAAHKSLIWYDIGAFERVGVVPPSDPESLAALADAMVDAGVPAFAVGAEDEWTLTDWFENLYLRLAGPDRYDALATHDLPWTDPSVVETLTLLGRLLSPPMATGGPDGVDGTSFPESVRLVFGQSPPAAAMVVEGDFVAGEITGSTAARLGVDADVFPFPDVDPSRRLVVGGGDAIVVMRPTAASRALLRDLATPEAAQVWARLGGFVSPNEDVDLSVYPDDISRSIARSLIEAGDGFRFDLSDLQPAAFGGTTGHGMFGILRAFVADPRDPAGAAARLEAEAAAAYRAVSGARSPDGSASPAPRPEGPAAPPTPASSTGGGPAS